MEVGILIAALVILIIAVVLFLKKPGIFLHFFGAEALCFCFR